MDAYLSKPIEVELLRRAVAALGNAAKIDSCATSRAARQPTGFDCQAGLRRCAGDGDLHKELATMFIEQSPEWVSRLRQTFQANDSAALAASAHKLKGSAAAIGAARLQQLGEQLEDLGLAGRLENAAECLEALQEEHARMTPLLEEYVGEA